MIPFVLRKRKRLAERVQQLWLVLFQTASQQIFLQLKNFNFHFLLYVLLDQPGIVDLSVLSFSDTNCPLL